MCEKIDKLEKMVSELAEAVEELEGRPSGTVVSDCTFDGGPNSEVKIAIAGAVQEGMIALQKVAEKDAPLFQVNS